MQEYYLARGIEDDHFWVVRDFQGVLVETPWRIEHEGDGYRLSHADDSNETARVYLLGAFERAEDAVRTLKTLLDEESHDEM